MYMFNQENASEVLKDIVNKIDEVDKTILEKYPLEKYIEYIEKDETSYGYKIKSKQIELICDSIIKESSIDTLALYHRAIMLSLLRKNYSKVRDKCILEDAIAITHENFNKIYDTTINNKGHFLYSNDTFCKNIAVSSLRLIPLGAQKINKNRMPFKILYKGGFKQFIKTLYMIVFTLRGIKPLYDIHTDSSDPDLLKEFNPDGWVRMYKRLARFLKVHKDVKGVVATSWFFDPVLNDISPRLTYLREIVTDNGGLIFYVGIDSGKDAISKSKTRRELYYAGKYVPKSYVLIWPRKKIIEWESREQ